MHSNILLTKTCKSFHTIDLKNSTFHALTNRPQKPFHFVLVVFKMIPINLISVSIAESVRKTVQYPVNVLINECDFLES